LLLVLVRNRLGVLREFLLGVEKVLTSYFPGVLNDWSVENREIKIFSGQ
jgi:hypothetical protein